MLSAEFFDKTRKFLRFLAEYLLDLDLYRRYIFVVVISLIYMLPAWLLALTLYMRTSIHINIFVFRVLNSNYFGRIWICLKPV